MTKINEINLPITLDLQLSPESMQLLANLQALVPEPTITRRLSTRLPDEEDAIPARLITAEAFDRALASFTRVWNSQDMNLRASGTLPAAGSRSRPAMAAALRELGIEVAEPADG